MDVRIGNVLAEEISLGEEEAVIYFCEDGGDLHRANVLPKKPDIFEIDKSCFG